MNGCVLRDIIHGWVHSGELPASAAAKVFDHLAPRFVHRSWPAQARGVAAYLHGAGRDLLAEEPGRDVEAALGRHSWELRGGSSWGVLQDWSRPGPPFSETLSGPALDFAVTARLRRDPEMVIAPPPDWVELRLASLLERGYGPHLRRTTIPILVRDWSPALDGMTPDELIEQVRLKLSSEQYAYATVKGRPIPRNLHPDFLADPFRLARIESAWAALDSADLGPGRARVLFTKIKFAIESASPADAQIIVRRAIASDRDRMASRPADTLIA